MHVLLGYFFILDTYISLVCGEDHKKNTIKLYAPKEIGLSLQLLHTQ